MPAPQRRRNIEPGFGPNLLAALTGKIASEIERKRVAQSDIDLLQKKAAIDQQQALELALLKGQLDSADSEAKGVREIEQIKARAQAEAEAKSQFPSAEDNLKGRMLELAQEEGRIPLRRAAAPSNISPYESSDAADVRAALTGAKKRELEILRGGLSKSADTGPTVPYYLTSEGIVRQAVDEQGNPVSIQGKNRIFQQPLSPEMVGRRTASKIEAETSPEAVSSRANAAARIKEAEAAAAPGLDKTTSVISAESSLRSIGELRGALSDPKVLLASGIPGVPGGRDINRILKNLELEIVTARGGKALTPSERELIRNVFPDRIDAMDAMIRNDPTVIEDKLAELEVKANSLISRVPIRPDASANPKAEAAKARLRAKYGQ